MRCEPHSAPSAASWSTLSSVASISCICRSSFTNLPLSCAIRPRMVVSAATPWEWIRWGPGGLWSHGKCTKLIEECRELRHAELDGLGEVALLPIKVHRLPAAQGRSRGAVLPRLLEHIEAGASNTRLKGGPAHACASREQTLRRALLCFLWDLSGMAATRMQAIDA